MAGGFSDQDKGWKALRKRLGDALGLSVTVGVHAPEGAKLDGKLTVAELATIQEYGLGVPERSFIRAWADDMRAENDIALRKIAQAIIKGKYDGRTGLDRFGLLCVGQIQTRISNGIPPANAPSTIKRKGSSTPLIDDGQLRSAIRHQVHGGGISGRISQAATSVKEGAKAARKASKILVKDAKRGLKKSLKKGKAQALKGIKRTTKKLVKQLKPAKRRRRS